MLFCADGKETEEGSEERAARNEPRGEEGRGGQEDPQHETQTSVRRQAEGGKNIQTLKRRDLFVLVVLYILLDPKQ